VTGSIENEPSHRSAMRLMISVWRGVLKSVSFYFQPSLLRASPSLLLGGEGTGQKGGGGEGEEEEERGVVYLQEEREKRREAFSGALMRWISMIEATFVM